MTELDDVFPEAYDDFLDHMVKSMTAQELAKEGPKSVGLKLVCPGCGVTNNFSEYAYFNPQGGNCKNCGIFIPVPNWKRR
jgi:uncharacterized protein (DUF983 family)